MIPVQKASSINEFQNFISYDASTRAVNVVAGAFKPLFAGTVANPGDTAGLTRGHMVFMTEAGVVYTP